MSKRSALLGTPYRPVGVRRSWRRVDSDPATMGRFLRASTWLVQPEWGDPIEAVEFRARGGALRRVEAKFANGRLISISWRRDGKRIERVRSWGGGLDD